MDMELLDVALKRVTQEMFIRGNYPEALCLVRRDDLRVITEAAASIHVQPIFKIADVLDFAQDASPEDLQSIFQVIYERI